MDALLVPTFFCPKSWETMAGDETSRSCGYCHKQVHNLAALTLAERLALLSSPAATICARYKLALRRPAKGRKESYERHLMKYGASVALAGSALLVLWELSAESNRTRGLYRVVAPGPRLGCDPDSYMPEDDYVQVENVALGMIVATDIPSPDTMHKPTAPVGARHVDIEIEHAQLRRMFGELSPPTIPAPRRK